MCGRFTLKTNPSEWGQLLLPELDMGSLASVTTDWQPRYNIAPTQSIIGMFAPSSAEVPHSQATIIARAFRWGLVPFWADDLAIGNRMINARSETLSDKPAFRTALANIAASSQPMVTMNGKLKASTSSHFGFIGAMNACLVLPVYGTAIAKPAITKFTARRSLPRLRPKPWHLCTIACPLSWPAPPSARGSTPPPQRPTRKNCFFPNAKPISMPTPSARTSTTPSTKTPSASSRP